MKRSGGPKRKTGLKRGDKPLLADPETTRAFVERGREKARERARKQEDEMRQARAQGVHPRAKRPADELTMRDALRTPFVARTSARQRECARCSTSERTVRAETWHHWLPQQHIRVFVRGLRRSPQTTRALLRKLLRDERNLAPLCWPCHDAHELRSRPLSGEEVPHKARIFALELGPEWAERLRRMYPGGQS